MSSEIYAYDKEEKQIIFHAEDSPIPIKIPIEQLERLIELSESTYQREEEKKRARVLPMIRMSPLFKRYDIFGLIAPDKASKFSRSYFFDQYELLGIGLFFVRVGSVILIQFGILITLVIIG